MEQAYVLKTNKTYLGCYPDSWDIHLYLDHTFLNVHYTHTWYSSQENPGQFGYHGDNLNHIPTKAQYILLFNTLQQLYLIYCLLYRTSWFPTKHSGKKLSFIYVRHWLEACCLMVCAHKLYYVIRKCVKLFCISSIEINCYYYYDFYYYYYYDYYYHYCYHYSYYYNY